MIKKIILISILLFSFGCSQLSSVFTPEVDKELNFQNVKAFQKIESVSIVDEVKEIAKTGEKNAIQLGYGSIGLPEDKTVDFSHKKSEDLREKSKEEADKGLNTDWLKGIETVFPWSALLITGLSIYTGYRKRKKLQELVEIEKNKKEVVFDGVDKAMGDLTETSGKILKERLQSVAGLNNLYVDINKDLDEFRKNK